MLEESPLRIPDKLITNNKTSEINAVIDFFVMITKSKANKVRTIANIITLTVTSKNNVNSKKFFRVVSRKTNKITAFTIENITVESVIFLPILVSLVYSTHYQFGDDYFSQLLIPNWKVRLTGFIASSIVLSLLSTLVISIVNAVILLIFLDSTLKNYLELTLFLDVTVRVMIFSIVLTLLALLFVIVTKKSMTSLIADVLLLVISLSGILRGISSKIENLLPLIGAKSFAFGRIEGTQMSQLYGFTLLTVEGILFLVFIMVVEKIRMGRKNGKSIFQSYRQKI